MLALDEIKTYLKIDTNYEDELIIQLQYAAECYLEEAGIIKSYHKGTYRLCVLMLISQYYSNRGTVIEGTKYIEEVPYGVKSIIQQLQLQGGV